MSGLSDTGSHHLARHPLCFALSDVVGRRSSEGHCATSQLLILRSWCWRCLSECGVETSTRARALILRGTVPAPQKRDCRAIADVFHVRILLFKERKFNNFAARLVSVVQTSQAVVEGKKVQDVAALKSSAHSSEAYLHGMPHRNAATHLQPQCPESSHHAALR